MKSPFPGMDPYIEACGLWEDFHTHLVENIAEAVADSLPLPYLVRSGERSYIQLVEAEGKETRTFKPDVSVTGPSPAAQAATGSENVAIAETETSTESVDLRAFIAEEYRETFVEVYLQEDDLRLVTCIEVLSPSNKRNGAEGWDLYLRKRQAMLMGSANLIEIDLLRGGRKFPMLDPWPNSPYTLLVCRRQHAPRCRVTKVSSLNPVPTLSVPLAFPDPDVSVELQPLIDRIYSRYRYGQSIDYRKACEPPLRAEEAVWLQDQLRTRAAGTPSPEDARQVEPEGKE